MISSEVGRAGRETACARRPPRSGRAGFTMVELMVVLGVAAFMLAMGVTGFQVLMQRGRVGTMAREFFSSVNLARSEAVRRGGRVTLCRSSDGATCAAVAAPDGWDRGWMVFFNPDPNGANPNDITVDAGDVILQVHGALPSGTLMPVNTDGHIHFSRQGLPTTGAETLTISNASKALLIVLSATGRLELQQP